MATRKRLGSLAPAATTETDLYNSPAAAGCTDVVISHIVVANRSATAATFRVSACPEGDATANDDYLAYDVVIGANEVIDLALGLTMEPDWDLRVYASTNTLSFTAWGQENAP